MVDTILLATDGSPSARAATARAIDLAAATDWPIRVLAVWHTPAIGGYGYAPVTVLPELAEAARDKAVEAAEAAVESALDAGVHATLQIREGVAAEQICDVARDLPASMIVIGAHGWNALGRLFFGGVATRVLHEAPCPVLVVRARDRHARTPGVEDEHPAAVR